MPACNTNIKQYGLNLVFVTLTSILVGCTKNSVQMQMHSLENQLQVLPQTDNVAISALVQKPAFAVLLLHGLMANSDELQPIAAKTFARFGDSVLIMQPKCRAGYTSVRQSTKDQAENVFNYIKSNLTACNKKAGSFPLIIIGYSHGGVLACILGNNYRNKLNIFGIITLNAPLMGTPVLERNFTDVQEFISHAQEGFQLIDCPRPLSKIQRNMGICARALTWIHWIPCVRGLKDIFPKSTCVDEVNNFVRHDANEIRFLLIGSHQNDFGKIFNLDPNIPEYNSAIKKLNNAYAQFVTGKNGGHHDTLIPLRSQLCRGESFSELSTIIDTSDNDPIIMAMPSQPNIKGHIYRDITHAGNLIVIDTDLFVNNGETALYSNRILNDLIKFMEEQVQGLV
ncbi:hypothetical protein [Candidatus Cardinium hertigii]|jgi:predicted esterase|uniref:DUF676 domain-containing protein n=1 Tax=Candidatus Cardinium hertigii TaxID=247481 RepID=A0A3N2QBT7_9BACT|nr:hypothetical protein [Candidatus Cardinium hertigii]ROT47119.1 hypothetical protein EDM02_04520 [Candidatus Cardinium hertigii]